MFLDRAKNLIQKAENILLVPSYDLDQESRDCAQALLSILENLGKNVNLADFDSNGQEFNSKNSRKKTSIIINTPRSQIQEIYYEKGSSALNIYIDHVGETINKDDIVINTRQLTQNTTPDLVITIGVNNLASLEQYLEDNFKLFFEKPIINIDNQESNDGFGQANLIELDEPLAKITIELIKTFGKKNITATAIESLRSSALQYLQKNNNNHNKLIEVLDFLAASETKQPIIESLEKPNFLPEAPKEQVIDTPLSPSNLWSRALEKLELEPQSQTVVLTFAEDDFKEANATAKDLRPVIEQLKNNPFLNFSAFLLIWPQAGQQEIFNAMYYSKDPQKTANICKNFGGESNGRAVIFETTEKNLSDAKQKITSFL